MFVSAPLFYLQGSSADPQIFEKSNLRTAADPPIFQKSVVWRAFAAFSVHLPTLCKQLQFRATQISSPGNREKWRPQNGNGTSGGARRCRAPKPLAAARQGALFRLCSWLQPSDEF